MTYINHKGSTKVITKRTKGDEIMTDPLWDLVMYFEDTLWLNSFLIIC